MAFSKVNKQIRPLSYLFCIGKNNILYFIKYLKSIIKTYIAPIKINFTNKKVRSLKEKNKINFKKL